MNSDVWINSEDQPSTSNNNTFSIGAERKRACIQCLANAVKKKKVQEALNKKNPLNQNEAFGQFVSATLDNLPPSAAIMAQEEI